MNVFSQEYAQQEIDAYGFPVGRSFGEEGGIVFTTQKVCGRCDDYLNVNFLSEEYTCPVFYEAEGEDNTSNGIWMSITRAEIQGHWVALESAQGLVATAGLGLGYFPIRAVQSGVVDNVDVYENDPRVVKAFLEAFDGREELDRINIIHGDVRELLVGKEYDFVFMDPYPTLFHDDILSDISHFLDNNDIAEYRFWGQEGVILSGHEMGLQPSMSYLEAEFFRMWLESPGYQLRPILCHDEEFVQDCLEALGRI